ncbi:unnamed protein product [Gongylonema pulchrum]|uniref:HELICc2 domain-containing protein n=1 Tax=Gongylonema pulchrum TaxID=637853 RepID=A0A183D0R9_9BILA|nr:unnamed protein product [Gongylonema pulchrum]
MLHSVLGINFSDELGRAVIIVGLPFVNKEDIAMKEKLTYLDEEYGTGSGVAYYESKCMHAINQSIGRVIRHRDDYASIIMLDSRYANPRITKASQIFFSVNAICLSSYVSLGF